MDIAGEMYRAFAVDGIPACRIGGTEILHFQADPHDRFFGRQVHDAGGCFPSGAAGRTAQDLHVADSTLANLDAELGGPELLTIPSQTYLPGQAASGRWRQGARSVKFLAGCHHRDVLLTADQCQVVGQIRMCQKVENEVGPDLCG